MKASTTKAYLFGMACMACNDFFLHLRKPEAKKIKHMIRVGHLAAGAIAGELAMLGISQTRSVAGRRHLFGAGCGCAS